MDGVERMRRKQAEKAERPGQEKKVQESAPNKLSEGGSSTASAKKPPNVITHSCGHYKALREYENVACPACRNETRKRKNAERAANRGADRAEKAQGQDQRLPDGSTSHVRYDATEQAWAGTLTVPSENAVTQVYPGMASGVFYLLRQLDQQFRESLRG